jgi:hypothetical protein
MTYLYCKRVIENKTFISKEDMTNKLDVFLLNSRITQTQYSELIVLLS